ncbi:UDP-2,3-diacylglucosamine diphosphatase LpxI domain-containing protein [Neoroseomonas oryzicola]|uniref:LpxI family protein n=1 Tax=Neoroseomonas oryzicola TaxID=535904 RepID=A0A9X9WEM6_9PROT|nr:LpxI family protein [Neoroseomonas oryzicola]NKE17264.1 LpxI family protein [Neoroseomonas oryzicola]
MSPPEGPLGIIAGGGGLPVRVAEAVAASGRPVAVAVLDGHGDPEAFAAFPSQAFRWGLAAQMLAWLKGHGVRQVVLAGTVSRPSLLSLRPDAAGMKLLARIGKAAFTGDDSILRAVMKVLAEDGFEVVGAQQVLAGLLPSAALLAGPAPDDLARADIQRGLAVCRALGAADVGQGCVVQQGLVLAVEAIEGTDAMLDRCGALRRDGPGGVLVKCVKPGQSRLADLPTIGPRTVEGAVAAGLRGLAFEADGTILLDRETTIARAAAAGLFLLAFDPGEFTEGTTA